MAYKSKKGNNLPKCRYWQGIAYPESLIENWLEIIQNEFSSIKFLISPLHDRDFNNDRSPKKAHYHLLSVFPNPRTEKAVSLIYERLGAVFHMPESRVISVESCISYFTHKNQPNKAQYSENDLTCLNGFNIEEFTTDLTMTPLERLNIKTELVKFIDDNFILTYDDFIRKIIEQNLPKKYLNVAMDSTIFFNNFIKGKWQALNKS